MARLRALTLGTTGVLAAPLLAALAAAPAQAAGLCTADLTGDLAGFTRYTWTGGAGDGYWGTAGNWAVPEGAPDSDKIPMEYLGDGEDHTQRSIVCIPSASVPVDIDDNTAVHVSALVVGEDVTIRASDARVLLYGGPDGSLVSSLATGSRLELRESYFGGTGTIDLAGHLEWGRLGDPTAASLDNDICDLAGNDLAVCGGTAPLPATGRLRVGAGGVLEVNGRGVNLFDGYRIDVLAGGEALVTGQGYVAADHSTTTTVEPGGYFTFAGDGNVFEGFDDGPALAAFVNDGTVRKTGGTTRSSLNVTYSGAGAVLVGNGGISINGGTPTPATVEANRRIGTGACLGYDISDPTRQCTPVPSVEDPQAAVVSPTAGAEQLAVQETPDTGTGDLQPVVKVTANDATRDVWSTIDFAFDTSVTPPREAVSIFRRRGDLQPERLPLCGAGGRIPRQVTACVVGRRTVGTSVRVRVRTYKPSGDWSLRRSRVDFRPLRYPLVGSLSGCMVMHPDWPYVNPYLRLDKSGAFDVRFSTTENTRGTGADAGGGTHSAGVFKIRAKVPRTGWIAAVSGGQSSGAFRVIATPSLRFRKRSKAAVAGKSFYLRGVVEPGGVRTLTLYAVRVPDGSRTGILRSTGIRVATDSAGRFTVRYRPRTSGRYLFAMLATGKNGLGTAMSREVVRVAVAPPAPAPAPTVTRDLSSSEKVTGGASGGAPYDPLDNLTNFYPGRAATCRFQARY